MTLLLPFSKHSKPDPSRSAPRIRGWRSRSTNSTRACSHARTRGNPTLPYWSPLWEAGESRMFIFHALCSGQLPSSRNLGWNLITDWVKAPGGGWVCVCVCVWSYSGWLLSSHFWFSFYGTCTQLQPRPSRSASVYAWCWQVSFARNYEHCFEICTDGTRLQHGNNYRTTQSFTGTKGGAALWGEITERLKTAPPSVWWRAEERRAPWEEWGTQLWAPACGSSTLKSTSKQV